MQKAITAMVTAAALASPVGAAAAATKLKKKVVTATRTVAGPQVETDRWGLTQVTLVVKKTTTTVGTKKTVARKITAVHVPVYPNHTDRSVFINEQAIPILVQETLTLQFARGIQMVSGATDTSYAFSQSLQAALALAKKV
jgi:uncharacterized protein with FMN-binding domain